MAPSWVALSPKSTSCLPSVLMPSSTRWRLASRRVALVARVVATAVAVGAVRAICTDLGRAVLRPASTMHSDLPYLQAYPGTVQDQVRSLMGQGGAALATLLQRKYPHAHSVRTDKALYQYTTALKTRYLRNADAVNKVVFDSKIHVVRHALGLHTTVSRVQGNRLADQARNPHCRTVQAGARGIFCG